MSNYTYLREYNYYIVLVMMFKHETFHVIYEDLTCIVSTWFYVWMRKRHAKNRYNKNMADSEGFTASVETWRDSAVDECTEWCCDQYAFIDKDFQMHRTVPREKWDRPSRAGVIPHYSADWVICFSLSVPLTISLFQWISCKNNKLCLYIKYNSSTVVHNSQFSQCAMKVPSLLELLNFFFLLVLLQININLCELVL